ncbi:hypothetical protein H6G18_14085 [Anabaena subtropica FACHB-260]|uniref:Uncharacterized protein n=1 Tax=Anabaena subtropica FACHB-260 TaxID=2692884 RepID=A0ABR8CRU4_9NOST|nr:hypothetical protein [Anabaena subtropica FACHB-260]
MNIFSFFSASSPQVLSTSSTNNDLFPSTIVVPNFPREPLPSITAPVFVYPKIS